LGQLGDVPVVEAEPGWLALLEQGDTFREAMPFGEPDAAPPHPDLAETTPDPHEAALARAFAEGEAAGRAAAEAEAAEQVARQRALRLNFRSLDEAATSVLAEDLAATVMALTEGVLGAVAIDRDGLLDRCHAAAKRIGAAADALALHLHPEDVVMLGEAALSGWRVVSDPSLQRGSLRLEGPDGSVGDGMAEWRRAIAAAVRG